MNKSPAFQFYPADWFDKRVQRMSYWAQGCYMNLLCHMWKDSRDQCSIESDIASIAGVLKLTTDQAEKLLEELLWPSDPIFVTKRGRFISKRLQHEKSQQLRRAASRSQAGSKGAAQRWQCHTFANGKAMANDSSSSSSSPSSSSSKEEGARSAPSGFLDDARKALEAAGTGDPIEADPPLEVAKAARDPAVHHLLGVARRTAKMPNRPDTLVTYLTAAKERYGAPKVEQWLMDPANVGSNVNLMLDSLERERKAADRIF